MELSKRSSMMICTVASYVASDALSTSYVWSATVHFIALTEQRAGAFLLKELLVEDSPHRMLLPDLFSIVSSSENVLPRQIAESYTNGYLQLYASGLDEEGLAYVCSHLEKRKLSVMGLRYVKEENIDVACRYEQVLTAVWSLMSSWTISEKAIILSLARKEFLTAVRIALLAYNNCETHSISSDKRRSTYSSKISP